MGIQKIIIAINKLEPKAKPWEVDANDLKLIVFSDHHRWSRDNADDFEACEETYIKALEYYYQRDYHLILLGDVEEFWENPFDRVMKTYANVLEKEKLFYEHKKLIRIWGNHDDAWQFTDKVNKLLGDRFAALQVYEGVNITVMNKGEKIGNALFIHGHQGTLLSSKLAGISKFFVRFGWRPIQRIFNIPLSTPSKDKGLRGEVNKAMDTWARRRKRQLVICGHTHQYIFGSNLMPDEAGKPCYFNTGCCSYGNGNISGIEISRGKIRLVEMTPEDSEPFYVAKEELTSIFEKCE